MEHRGHSRNADGTPKEHQQHQPGFQRAAPFGHHMVRQCVCISVNICVVPDLFSPATLGIQLGYAIDTQGLQQANTIAVVSCCGALCTMPQSPVCSGFARSAITAATPRRSGMWCASNSRHAWLSDRFARGLVRASCLCHFKGWCILDQHDISAVNRADDAATASVRI